MTIAWIALVVCLSAAVAVAVRFRRRDQAKRGTVSERWLAEQRVKGLD